MRQRDFGSRRMLCAALAAVMGAVQGALGAVTGSGDVLPANPATWTNVTTGYIGNTSAGSVTVNLGNGLSSWASYVGNGAGGNGTVTVDGTGSTWMCGSSLTINNGLVRVANGGLVSNSGNGLLAFYSGKSGTVTVDGLGSAWTCGGSLTIGNAGTGVLTISHGGSVSNAGYGYLGFGTAGTATVDGAGSTWTCGGTFTLGWSNKGTLNITNGGSMVVNGSALFGNTSSTTSTLTVDGTDSTWSCAGSLTLGALYGKGVVNITNGGLVNVGGDFYVATNSGSTGAICFGDHGGTLTTGAFYGSLSQFTGVGTLNTHGWFNDEALVFDKNHEPEHTFNWTNDKANVTVNVVSVKGTYGTMRIGNTGAGSMAIGDGLVVQSSAGYLGYAAGSSGTVAVNGGGSRWDCSGNLWVGLGGTGTMHLTNGGLVNCAAGFIGGDSTAVVEGNGSVWNCSGSLGVATVPDIKGAMTICEGGKVTVGSRCSIGNGGDGVALVDGGGSALTCSGDLVVGGYPSTLTITNAGTVTAVGVTVYTGSLMTINVGDGSKVDAGKGSVTNYGAIRLKAVANATAGVYTPIVAARWSTTGHEPVQALGGRWDTSSHVFTVSEAAAGVPGVGVGIDRGVRQRVVITDGATLDCVQAGFMGTSGSANLTLTGWELTAEQEAGLVGVLPAGQVIEDGWTFGAEGYTAGDPVFLSMKVGAVRGVEDLAVWHYDGSAWTPYAAGDLSYDGTYASFTVTGFSGYAVTGVVPEPGSLVVVALGMTGTLRRRRRRV